MKDKENVYSIGCDVAYRRIIGDKECIGIIGLDFDFNSETVVIELDYNLYQNYITITFDLATEIGLLNPMALNKIINK